LQSVPTFDPARDTARFRAVRLHCPYGQGGDHRGAELGLRTDRDAQGAAAGDRDPAARAAQLAAADDHGHRDPDRVPDRRARGGGGPVQLPGPRGPDLQGGEGEGLRGAGGRGPHHRRGLRGGHTGRGPAADPAQPAATHWGHAMSGSVPPPAEPGATSPVAPIDRTGGYLGATGAAAVVAASRATPARWRLLLGKATFWAGA